MGKTVQSNMILSLENNVNLENIKPGVYILEIETQKGLRSLKMIKE